MGANFSIGYDIFEVKKVNDGFELHKNGEVFSYTSPDKPKAIAKSFQKAIVKKLKQDKNAAIKSLMLANNALNNQYEWDENVKGFIYGGVFHVGEQVFEIKIEDYNANLYKNGYLSRTLMGYRTSEEIIDSFTQAIIQELEFNKVGAISSLTIAYNCLTRKKEWSKYLYVEDEG